MARRAAELHRIHPERRQVPLPLADTGERISAKVAHDLLGIVTVIHGFAELLPGQRDAKLQTEITQRIQRACRRLTEFVERSLVPESEVVVLKRQRVELPGFLTDLLGTHALRAHQKEIALRLELGPMAPTVNIDSGSVERILGNLIENAIKFSRPASTIILRASVIDGSLELAVEDDGPGIPGEEIATLFNEYQTGSARPTGNERSTGLGLSIVKDLVRAHQGVIGVRSQIGLGTTFSIRLPLEPDRVYPIPILEQVR